MQAKKKRMRSNYMKRTVVVFLFCLFFSCTLSAQGESKDSIRKPLKNEVSWLQKALHEENWALSIEKMVGPRGIIPMSRIPTMLLSAKSVSASLPYIGQISAPNLSRNSTAVDFEGRYSNYEILNLKKDYIVKFSISEVGENYKIKLVISPNGYTTLTVSSNARSDIKYMGTIHNIPTPTIQE